MTADPNDQPGTAAQTRGAGSGAWLVATELLALAMAIAMIVVGARLGGGWVVLAAAGCVSVVLLVLLAPVAWLLASRLPARGPDSDGGMASLARSIERLSEQAGLSADARRVLNRRAERELLCRAIEEDIAAEDWDAAMVLVKELAERFGYRAEAEEFRQRIERARQVTLDRKVADAIAGLDGLIVQRRWEPALREAGRIARLYPDAPRVSGLAQRVERARATYKQDLERRFLNAAQEDRIDEAMELLKELDAYLTEEEAEPYREVARGVIGKARENLGVRFKLAMQDRRWNEAAATGERIIAEFPNSRMATEVRGLLDVVRDRTAGGEAPAHTV